MVMQLPQGPTTFGSNVLPFPSSALQSMKQDARGYGLGADERFRAHGFYTSLRRLELLWRQAFYAGTQHDQKAFDFNGNMIAPGGPRNASMGLQANASPFYIPFASRRPLAPVRLLRTIVRRFTSLLFGEKRFPRFSVPGDPKSQEFYEALARAERLQHVMKRGRNLGGSVGTVGFSWRFFEGQPRVRAHSGANLHVHEWEDREELIPKHASQVLVYEQEEWNNEKKRFEKVNYWHRRDWTPDADIVFMPCKVTAQEPQWQVDEAESVEHRDGFAHLVWVQNEESDEELAIDGVPDYHAVFESSNALDILNSVVMKGASANLDPTLILKMDPKILQMHGIKKGSDNALNVGPQGDAHYMELAAAGLEAGVRLTHEQRKLILEACECVIPDPDELSAANASGAAIELLFGPMLDHASSLRVTYGTAIERLLEQQAVSYRKRQPVTRIEGNTEIVETDVETDEETGEEVEVKASLELPPKVVETEDVDELGNPTGDVSITIEEVELGERIDLDLEWPSFFEASDADKQAKATTLVSANGGKPLMSQKTAVEHFATVLGTDPGEEWQKVLDQQRREAEQAEGMFPGTGGQVSSMNELPPGAEELEPKEEAAKGPTIPDSYLPAVVFVNEVRKAQNLPPIPEAEGITVEEWKAMRAARAAEQGKALGAAEGKAAADAIAPPPAEPVAAEPAPEELEPHPLPPDEGEPGEGPLP